MTETTESNAIEIIPIPDIRDAAGRLKTLKAKHFPKSREGRAAYCLYRAECYKEAAKDWEGRAQELLNGDNPEFLRKRKIERLRKALEALEAE